MALGLRSCFNRTGAFRTSFVGYASAVFGNPARAGRGIVAIRRIAAKLGIQKAGMVAPGFTYMIPGDVNREKGRRQL